MGLSIGIVGLPNVGKSTLFNALSNAGALAANYPFATIEPNIGVVPVPDDRLEKLAALIKPEKKDMYDEDWHAQREGDTYAIISKEYYKTVDYSAALEAYNKERKKSGERIVRVPPTWVLEEQFPNLVGAKPEKPR